jgi:hypothetical protein
MGLHHLPPIERARQANCPSNRRTLNLLSGPVQHIFEDGTKRCAHHAHPKVRNGNPQS